MSVERICTRQVDLAEPDEPLWQAAERMHQRTVGALVVLNEDRHPIGILTDRDMVIRALAKMKDPGTTRVREIMTPDPVTVVTGTPIEDALHLMRNRKFRRLPVVDAKGMLIGLLTLDDILMLLSEEIGEVGELLQRQTPRAAAAV